MIPTEEGRGIMKYVFQFGIIAGVTFAGELFKNCISLPIPASVWGLVFMLLLLLTKAVKTEQVKDAAGFLILVMPLMFVPPSVGLMVTWERLRPILVPIVVITAVSTVLVMVVSGKVTDLLIRKEDTNE